ncbi:NEAT domain-containing protein [Levilactobacillus wangkuiensis]|uniref:NEAT domain-containing protein n=1 Tax=Levilactobacillus wangkuiensis TaxID=2799566 RepID=UPI001943A30D|nr:NEAT domain-containing protein [Levilactobacillus wangkuiensis]
MKHLQQLFRVIACLVVGLVFLGWAQMTDGHAATLSNGLYQVPMKIIKADSSATSDANQFFGKTAVVRVNHAQVTVLITSNGAKYIKKMTVADRAVTLVKTVDHQAVYQFNLTTQTSPLTTVFSLTTPMGAMKEQARLTLNWAQAKSVSKSVATTDLIAQAETLAKANASSQSSAVTVPKTTTKAKTATSTAKKTTAATEYWRYQVLQGAKMTKSEADQYYTDVATVTPKGTGYQVTLHVKYAKSLKLGPRAVVPKRINGAQPQNVTYGQSGRNYTMSYTFTVGKRSALTQKLIPGRIHVTVPTMNISQTFPIRFRFARSGAADQAAAATVAALPHTTVTAASASTSPTATSTTTKPHQATLPPTGEATNNWAVLGLVGLALGGFIWRGGRAHV